MRKWKEIKSIFKRWIIALLYPRAANCLCCKDPRRAAFEDCLCDDCREGLKERKVPPEACNRCLSPVKKGKPCAFCKSQMMQPIKKVYAPYRYGDEVRQLIHAFKFDACDEALPLLADAMTDALTERDFDCIVPVPLHEKRLKQRGFNQSLLLAQAIGDRIQVPVMELLERTEFHKPQSRTAMEKRQKNVEKVFSACEDAKDKRILLLDDVRTSGSTAWACANALKKAGAESVSLCVAAVVYRGKNRKRQEKT